MYAVQNATLAGAFERGKTGKVEGREGGGFDETSRRAFKYSGPGIKLTHVYTRLHVFRFRCSPDRCITIHESTRTGRSSPGHLIPPPHWKPPARQSGRDVVGEPGGRRRRRSTFTTPLLHRLSVRRAKDTKWSRGYLASWSPATFSRAPDRNRDENSTDKSTQILSLSLSLSPNPNPYLNLNLNPNPNLNPGPWWAQTITRARQTQKKVAMGGFELANLRRIV